MPSESKSDSEDEKGGEGKGEGKSSGERTMGRVCSDDDYDTSSSSTHAAEGAVQSQEPATKKASSIALCW